MKPVGKILNQESENKFQITPTEICAKSYTSISDEIKGRFDTLQNLSNNISETIKTSNFLLKNIQTAQELHQQTLTNSLSYQTKQLKNHIDDELANNIRIVAAISDQTNIIKQMVDSQNQTNEHIYTLTLAAQNILEYMRLPWYKKLFYSFK